MFNVDCSTFDFGNIISSFPTMVTIIIMIRENEREKRDREKQLVLFHRRIADLLHINRNRISPKSVDLIWCCVCAIAAFGWFSVSSFVFCCWLLIFGTSVAFEWVIKGAYTCCVEATIITRNTILFLFILLLHSANRYLAFFWHQPTGSMNQHMVSIDCKGESFIRQWISPKKNWHKT